MRVLPSSRCEAGAQEALLPVRGPGGASAAARSSAGARPACRPTSSSTSRYLPRRSTERTRCPATRARRPRVLGAHQLGVVHLHGRERRARDALGELAPDRLDLRKLRHRRVPPPAPATEPDRLLGDPQAGPTISRARPPAVAGVDRRPRAGRRSTRSPTSREQLDPHRGVDRLVGVQAPRPEPAGRPPPPPAPRWRSPAGATGRRTSMPLGARREHARVGPDVGVAALRLHPALGRRQRGVPSAAPRRPRAPLALLGHPGRLGQPARHPDRQRRARRAGPAPRSTSAASPTSSALPTQRPSGLVHRGHQPADRRPQGSASAAMSSAAARALATSGRRTPRSPALTSSTMAPAPPASFGP